MFGFGKKDRDGRQVRLEHRGENLRASRTGGLSARVQGKAGPVTATANTAHGIRLSTRLARGLRVAFQNSNARLVGRWNSGPVSFNLSKSGGSASIKTSTGRLNVIRPGRSSFKMAGIHVRGKKAAKLQLITLFLDSIFGLIGFSFKLVVLAFKLVILAFRMILGVLWLALTVILFVIDFVAGFVEGASKQGSRR